MAFLVLYPNISALPLPSIVVNAYQGLLPTYLYPFQFPVNTDPAAPGLKLFSLEPAMLFIALSVTCGSSATRPGRGDGPVDRSSPRRHVPAAGAWRSRGAG